MTIMEINTKFNIGDIVYVPYLKSIKDNENNKQLLVTLCVLIEEISISVEAGKPVIRYKVFNCKGYKGIFNEHSLFATEKIANRYCKMLNHKFNYIIKQKTNDKR